jgi:hypothetical protein
MRVLLVGYKEEMKCKELKSIDRSVRVAAFKLCLALLLTWGNYSIDYFWSV